MSNLEDFLLKRRIEYYRELEYQIDKKIKGVIEPIINHYKMNLDDFVGKKNSKKVLIIANSLPVALVIYLSLPKELKKDPHFIT